MTGQVRGWRVAGWGAAADAPHTTSHLALRICRCCTPTAGTWSTAEGCRGAQRVAQRFVQVGAGSERAQSAPSSLVCVAAGVRCSELFDVTCTHRTATWQVGGAPCVQSQAESPGRPARARACALGASRAGGFCNAPRAGGFCNAPRAIAGPPPRQWEPFHPPTPPLALAHRNGRPGSPAGADQLARRRRPPPAAPARAAGPSASARVHQRGQRAAGGAVLGVAPAGGAG